MVSRRTFLHPRTPTFPFAGSSKRPPPPFFLGGGLFCGVGLFGFFCSNPVLVSSLATNEVAYSSTEWEGVCLSETFYWIQGKRLEIPKTFVQNATVIFCSGCVKGQVFGFTVIS